MKNNFKPILFSTPMVQAILQGRKTQTRRLLKPQPYKTEDFVVTGLTENKKVGEILRHPKKGKYDGIFTGDAPKLWPAKYQVGDVLWVRESFCLHGNDDNVLYKVNHPEKDYSHRPIGGWKPSIHMPKAAARIFLFITNVRVERLNDISEADAIAEGLEIVNYSTLKLPIYKDYFLENLKGCFSPVNSFRSLWKKINGKDSWRQNSYVWVYDFEVIEKPKDF